MCPDQRRWKSLHFLCAASLSVRLCLSLWPRLPRSKCLLCATNHRVCGVSAKFALAQTVPDMLWITKGGNNYHCFPTCRSIHAHRDARAIIVQQKCAMKTGGYCNAAFRRFGVPRTSSVAIDEKRNPYEIDLITRGKYINGGRDTRAPVMASRKCWARGR